MATGLIDYDPLNRISCYLDENEVTGECRIIHVGDTDDVIEANRAQQNDDTMSGDGIKDCWWKFASIPAIVQMKWMTEYGVDVLNKHHAKKVFQLLNDPEWRYLKCTTGRHLITADR